MVFRQRVLPTVYLRRQIATSIVGVEIVKMRTGEALAAPLRDGSLRTQGLVGSMLAADCGITQNLTTVVYRLAESPRKARIYEST